MRTVPAVFCQKVGRSSLVFTCEIRAGEPFVVCRGWFDDTRSLRSTRSNTPNRAQADLRSYNYPQEEPPILQVTE